MRWLIASLIGGIGAAILSQPAVAGVVNANPSNYRTLLRDLKPGDILTLAPGTYPRLNITGLNGRSDAWITITGPAEGPPAIIAGASDHNTVEIVNSSYLAIENLRIDSLGIPGAFGISARGHENNLTHDIRIEGNTLIGQNGDQQTDGISTKTPTWNWIIRYNQIIGAGTGMYLGDSDGTQPFVAGIIEHNLIQDTIGYNMEIKHQNSIPAVPGIPLGPTSTVIRNNVFIKNDGPSPDGDRPNLLVGSFPATGTGSLNMYEIYANYFVHNHREALFQGSGRFTLHDNIFIDGPYTYPAVVLRNQNGPLKVALVYNNTVYTAGRGIYFGSRAQLDDAVAGNLVFASNPISGQIMGKSDNLVDSVENAPKYVRAPSFDPGMADFYPLPGKCQGAELDLSSFHTDADYTLDFNGTSKIDAKGAVVFRGAYSGEGTNPGWSLEAGLKPPTPPSSASTARLVWIDPKNLRAGVSTPVTLTGTNFHDGDTIGVSGSGVKVSQVKVEGATRITAILTIDRGAPAQPRDVTVSSQSGTSNTVRIRVVSGAVRPAPADLKPR